MRLSRICFAAALLLTCFSAAVAQQDQPATSIADIAPPVHPCTAEQVREYMRLNGAEVKTHRLMATMIKAMRTTGNPTIPPAMWDEMEAEFTKVDVVALALPAYQKYLSVEDLNGMLAFYRSPVGQHYLASSPMIESLARDAGQAEGLRIGRELAAKYKDEIAARAKALDEEAAARAGKAAEPTIQLKQEPK